MTTLQASYRCPILAAGSQPLRPAEPPCAADECEIPAVAGIAVASFPAGLANTRLPAGCRFPVPVPLPNATMLELQHSVRGHETGCKPARQRSDARKTSYQFQDNSSFGHTNGAAASGNTYLSARKCSALTALRTAAVRGSADCRCWP